MKAVLPKCSAWPAQRLAHTPSSATALSRCSQTALSRATAATMNAVSHRLVFCDFICFSISGKLCVHNLLALLHMKISEHPLFGVASAAKASKKEKGGSVSTDGKEPKTDSLAQSTTDVHRDQAVYELKHRRLKENSLPIRKLLNRRVVPGECVLGASCPSLGNSKDSRGQFRGEGACDHSFPTHVRVGLKQCLNPACGAFAQFNTNCTCCFQGCPSRSALSLFRPPCTPRSTQLPGCK